MYYELTQASRFLKAEQTALEALRLESGDSPELAEMGREISKATIGGCSHLSKGGICNWPSYGTCDGAGCADVIVGEDGLGYWVVEDDDDW